MTRPPATAAGTVYLTPSERFWARVEPDANGCLIWTGPRSTSGYGRFAPRRTRPVQAHRFAYEEQVGSIAPGLTIDHLCRIRLCVNPEHMEPIANRDNLLRGIGVSAVNARKVRCPSGHPYSATNTIHRRDGGRTCRTCNRARNRRWWNGPRRDALAAARRLIEGVPGEHWSEANQAMVPNRAVTPDKEGP